MRQGCTYAIEILRINKTLGNATSDLGLKFGALMKAAFFVAVVAIKIVPAIATIAVIQSLPDVLYDFASNTSPVAPFPASALVILDPDAETQDVLGDLGASLLAFGTLAYCPARYRELCRARRVSI